MLGVVTHQYITFLWSIINYHAYHVKGEPKYSFFLKTMMSCLQCSYLKYNFREMVMIHVVVSANYCKAGCKINFFSRLPPVATNPVSVVTTS